MARAGRGRLGARTYISCQPRGPIPGVRRRRRGPAVARTMGVGRGGKDARSGAGSTGALTCVHGVCDGEPVLAHVPVGEGDDVVHPVAGEFLPVAGAAGRD